MSLERLCASSQILSYCATFSWRRGKGFQQRLRLRHHFHPFISNDWQSETYGIKESPPGWGHLILLLCDDAVTDELFCALCQDPLLLPDLLVHQRLGEHWLVHLIMAVTSVAHLKIRMERFQRQAQNVYKFKESELKSGPELPEDILNLPDRQPRLYGTCSSIQSPPCTRISLPLRHRH